MKFELFSIIFAFPGKQLSVLAGIELTGLPKAQVKVVFCHHWPFKDKAFVNILSSILCPVCRAMWHEDCMQGAT